ncbi:hypothetical protein BH11PSE12_BH11PSE12_13410 [soil metagenome]
MHAFFKDASRTLQQGGMSVSLNRIASSPVIALWRMDVLNNLIWSWQ